MDHSDNDSPEAKEGTRMRHLRIAEGFEQSSAAFAKRMGWGANLQSMYEGGTRRVPRDAALHLVKMIPGFDPLWLWTGEKRGLSHDLRMRIERIEQEDAAKGEETTVAQGKSAS